jgi:putative tryptophan/tyrosine transport system substrate-binding protein
MKRRQFITLLGGAALAWPCNGLAQSPPKRPLVAFLGAASKAKALRYYDGFALGMRELGYLEGRDYGFLDRYADGDASRLPSLAEELVRLNPDVIVATTTPGAVAAKQANGNYPDCWRQPDRPRRLWSGHKRSASGNQCDRGSLPAGRPD